jgi:hypothetical protein
MLFAVVVLAGCHHDTDPAPVQPVSEPPPLPPSSGTPVGYLIDNAGQLKLRDDQLAQLQAIDKSLSAKDDQIDTQLRIIEKPDEEQPEKGKPLPHHNNAPGAQIKTTPDAAKLHQLRKSNDTDALKQAFAVLDPTQQTSARALLEERGVAAPGSETKQTKRSADDGTPLPE